MRVLLQTLLYKTEKALPERSTCLRRFNPVKQQTSLENSENKPPSAPRIAIYLNRLELDKRQTNWFIHSKKKLILENEYDMMLESI
jgi:hypothetical protein